MVMNYQRRNGSLRRRTVIRTASGRSVFDIHLPSPKTPRQMPAPLRRLEDKLHSLAPDLGSANNFTTSATDSHGLVIRRPAPPRLRQESTTLARSWTVDQSRTRRTHIIYDAKTPIGSHLPTRREWRWLISGQIGTDASSLSTTHWCARCGRTPDVIWSASSRYEYDSHGDHGSRNGHLFHNRFMRELYRAYLISQRYGFRFFAQDADTNRTACD